MYNVGKGSILSSLNTHLLLVCGRKVIRISGSLICSKTLMELIFNSCGEFWWSLEGLASQIYSPHLHVDAPEVFSDLLWSIQMLKRECSAESNGKLLHLFIPSKTATLVPEFAVEDLLLGRTATLVPEFAVEDLPLGRTATLVPEFAVKDLTLGTTHWWWLVRSGTFSIIFTIFFCSLKTSCMFRKPSERNYFRRVE